MLNVLFKPGSWILAGLIISSTIFAENSSTPVTAKEPCKKDPCKPDPCQKVCSMIAPVLNPAYNHPARMEVKYPWHVSADVGFLYWQPMQENMELGVILKPSHLDPIAVATAVANGSVVKMNFDYKPGFTVSVGMNFDYDDWDVQADYYWFHNSNRKQIFDSNYVSGASNPFLGGGILPSWGFPSQLADAYDGNFYNFQSAGEEWSLGMDIIDLDLGRWYYVGRKLVFRPDVGLRAAFIHQRVHVFYLNGSGSQQDSSVVGLNVDIVDKSNSWAIGPRVGLQTNWMLGQGFKFYANGEGDLLYTRYTTLVNRQSNSLQIAPISFNSHPFNMNFKQKEVGTLRTHLDLELGVGWGTYIDCNKWYLDFTAGYEFQVFCDANMFRNYVDCVAKGFGFNPNGNLYVQGLTATARLDF